jgi:hypothetical protein
MLNIRGQFGHCTIYGTSLTLVKIHTEGEPCTSSRITQNELGLSPQNERWEEEKE